MSNIPDIIPLVFVSGKKENIKHGQMNILTPLVSLKENNDEELELFNMKDYSANNINNINNYKSAYTNVYNSKVVLPSDHLIRYYIIFLTIIFLYVFFRLTIPGRRF